MSRKTKKILSTQRPSSKDRNEGFIHEKSREELLGSERISFTGVGGNVVDAFEQKTLDFLELMEKHPDIGIV
jgi:hypothetical protein